MNYVEKKVLREYPHLKELPNLAKGVAELYRDRFLTFRLAAMAIRKNPRKARRLATQRLERVLKKESGSRVFFERWDFILKNRSIPQICYIMRDRSEATDQLRLCNPFAGILPQSVISALSHKVYGQKSH